MTLAVSPASAQEAVPNQPPPLPEAAAQGAVPLFPMDEDPAGATPDAAEHNPAAPQDSTAADAATPDPGVPNFFNSSSDAALAPEPGLDGSGVPDGFAPAQSKEEVNEAVRTEAFDAALQGVLPLRPQEIRELLERFDRTQESVELPVYPAPKPEVAVETVSLDPGAPPVTVHVAIGHVTTLTILDETGSPWPIEDISWAGNFEVIETSSSSGSHIVRISPQSEFATGNMSIRLLTLKTPVIISLDTRRDIVHYRFDAIIPEYGPMAQTPLIEKGITTVAGNADISSVLQGIAPKGAKKMDVSGVDGRTTAYTLNGQTFVRTPLKLLSPAWNSSVASADGMTVYSIQEAPVLLLSDKGKMVRARLATRENILESVIDEQ